jgi:hypothetical protein
MQASLLLINGMYSYGWRNYMPDIGRWNGIDQLAENYLSTSTYAYVANNPFQSYNLNAPKIAEGIWEIPLIPKQFNGFPINPIDYNYQIKKK